MRASSVRATAHAIVTSGDESDQDFDTSLDQWVRKPSNVRDGGSVPHQSVEHPAHPSNRLVAQLNTTWRVVDDPPQWILQRKKGNPRKKNSGWRSRSFCTTRGALLRCVREYCGDVDTTALVKLAALASDHAMQIPPETPGPEGAPKMVCVPKLQTDFTVLGTAAASDRMADKRMLAKD
jgi:hypothetical protein